MAKGGYHYTIVSSANVPSALSLALRKAEHAIAWLLCHAGADINEVDSEGMTALHRACRDGRLKEIELLLSNGADLTAKHKSGSTALHYAVLNGRERILHLLLSQSAARQVIDGRDGKGNTALILAILRRNEAMLQSLVTSGASCEGHDSAGLTPLHLAASLGFNTGLALLLSRTNDIDEIDNHGYNAIHHAVNSSDANRDTIQLLAEGGVNIEAQDDSGLTPLMLAVHLGHVSMTHHLLAQSVDVYARNDRGWSAVDLIDSQGYQSREHNLIRTLLLRRPSEFDEFP
ncbi:Nuclear factor NF-kappa-B p105 subunit [Fusarium irregulare]|uniref:Nuclear factor NF-kappa-B p105 subunit n=1 Tax=Fusarium irregulare TaxID=2494466 RepID=A0A9W8PKZ9_9HYPO|nr:Nuclear factor NF-kappa-B p105 subunit [Fusarium irregulare]